MVSATPFLGRTAVFKCGGSHITGISRNEPAGHRVHALPHFPAHLNPGAPKPRQRRGSGPRAPRAHGAAHGGSLRAGHGLGEQLPTDTEDTGPKSTCDSELRATLDSLGAQQPFSVLHKRHKSS